MLKKIVIGADHLGKNLKDKIVKEISKTIMPDLEKNITNVFWMNPKDFKNDYNSMHGAGFSIAPIFTQSAWFRYHNKDKKIKNGVDKFILSVSENGYGKRSSYLDYRVTNRGGKGIMGIINSPRNGNISASLVVNQSDEIILSTDKGSIMRCAVKEIRVAGRNTQGVRIKKLSGTEKVVSVIKIEDNIQ